MTVQNFFTFSASWPKDSSDVAEISLRVGDRIISRIADTEKHTVRDSFRASSTSLAFWFADNWWRLRWETINPSGFPPVDWRLRHELNSASGGALWPPVMIYSVGDRISFSPSVGKKAINGPQSYFPFNVGMVPASEYEAQLDSFFSAAISHCAQSEDVNGLTSLLRQITTERSDSELAAWRRLEACLGFDPDAAPDEVIYALVALEDVAGEDGVEEAAHAQPGTNAAHSLSLAIEASRESSVEVDLSLAAVLKLSGHFPNNGSPSEMAESAATELRSILGIKRGPLKKAAFEDLFKSRWAALKNASATARELPYGASLRGEKNTRLALQTINPTLRRFELARQFGDAVWRKSSSFGIVSRSKSDRQKFQRAFAHNFLCPFEDLQQVIDVNDPKSEDISAAAKDFDVHPTVVHNQLVYRGYLPFNNADEEAEAA